MRDTFEQLRFDEHERLKELIAQLKGRRESAITGNGHGLAMSAASAGMSPIAKVNEELGGLSGIRLLKQLAKRIEEPESLASLADELAGIHQKMLASSKELLIIAEDDQLQNLCADIAPIWQDFNADPSKAFELPTLRAVNKEFWLANSQVNFCAKAYPTVPSGHPDAPVLTVLAVYLRNGFLHRAIREQGGAYGGGASQDSNIAAFRFYSYRDPRLQETLSDFDKSITWMLSTAVSAQGLEEAILGVVGSIDKPGSPAGEAKQDYHSNIFGRTIAERRQFRQRVLAVSAEDLLRVCELYFTNVEASVAVVSNETKADALADWIAQEGMTIQRL
jgi:Zn-dependent M16 (insulinase) family peptidase